MVATFISILVDAPIRTNVYFNLFAIVMVVCIFHPFIDANHGNVLESIQSEINDLIRLSDGIGVSRNPLIRVHESTKFEIESVIARCVIQKDDIYES